MRDRREANRCRLKITSLLAFALVAAHLTFSSSTRPDGNSRSFIVRRLVGGTELGTESGDISGRKWWGGIDDDDDGGDDDTDMCSGKKIRHHSIQGFNYSNSCAFVEDYCNGKGTGLLAYMYFHYCTMASVPALSFIVLICWLLVIISLLATTADFFFVPQLETLSTYLHLTPDVAGITLLALGNGAPDVFAAKAALTGGETDFPLMLSDLLGASVFISTVVLGAVCWVSNKTYKNWQIDKQTFMRDVGVYIVAVITILVTASNGTISQVEAAFYLVIYFLYIIIVVVQSNMKLRKAALVAGDVEEGDGEGGEENELEEPLVRREGGEDGEDGEEDEEDKKGVMFGVDWDPEADWFTKGQFIVE